MTAEAERIALIVQYQGNAYHGWQYQSPDTPTVQMELERSLSVIADESIKLHCAGRTDTGVHATAQVVHFDTVSKREMKAWTEGANTLLAPDISVKWAGSVASEFHARFSARSRRYRYFIWNGSQRTAFCHQHTSWFRYPLDESLMAQAGSALIGEQDFQAFRAAGCQSRSSFRNVSDVKVRRQGELIMFDIEANAFLLHMVRNIVGSLLLVGQKKRPPEWIAEVLAKKDRKKAGVTAPAQGLHLIKVDYPDCFGIPSTESPEIVLI